MKDGYVGDIGDFGKYGLLRALCGDNQGPPDLGLGIVWCLNNDKEKAKGGGLKKDGKFTEFLNENHPKKDLYRQCDERLYDTLADIVHNDRRKVASIRQSDLFPPGTVFHEPELTFRDMPGIGTAATVRRLEHREAWVDGAVKATVGCDVVFLDPDNGLEVKSAKRHCSKGPKYVFYDELTGYLKREQSLIIYQHVWREPIDRIAEQRVNEIRNSFGFKDLRVISFHPYQVRLYIIIPAPAHQDVLINRLDSFLEKSRWKNHFKKAYGF